MTWLAETVMLSHGWRRWLILVVAGAIAAASVPPFFLLPALFLALPVWVWALDGAERIRGWRSLVGPAFRIGFAFGWGYFTVAFHWLGAAFLLEGGLYLITMPFAILALAALIALFWGLASALAHLCWSHGLWRIVTLTAFLGLAEYARGTLFSGFPFDLLGYALTATNEMMQLASIIGVYGLTLLAAGAQAYTAFSTSQWMVAVDSPAERAALDLEVTLPSAWKAAGSGREVSRVERAGTTTYRWRQERETASFLYGFVAGQFAEAIETRGAVTLRYLGSPFSSGAKRLPPAGVCAFTGPASESIRYSTASPR